MASSIESAPRGDRLIRISVALLAIWLCVLPGCRSVTLPSAFEPAPAESEARGARLAIDSLVVSAGEDARPLGGRSSVGAGFLAWIPLVPYGHQRFSPEFPGLAASLASESLLSDLATVVARDLRAAGVADRVVQEGVKLEDLSTSRADEPTTQRTSHELRLTLDEGIYHRNLTLYGLSFAGAFLWIVGLPVSYGSADLAITAELFAPDGRSLGSESFAEKSRATEWLYRPLGPAYSRAMPRAYGAISSELRSFVLRTLDR